jgi:hypothetical protein
MRHAQFQPLPRRHSGAASPGGRAVADGGGAARRAGPGPSRDAGGWSRRDERGAAHFGAGLVGCEHPFDAGAGGVSLSFPCIMQSASCYWSILSKPSTRHCAEENYNKRDLCNHAQSVDVGQKSLTLVGVLQTPAQPIAQTVSAKSDIIRGVSRINR